MGGTELEATLVTQFQGDSTMFRKIFRAALVAGVFSTLVGISPADANAQWSPGLVVKLGATLPLGDFGDATGVGYHVGVGAEFTRSISPVGFRFEVDFHENEFDDDIAFFGGEKFRMLTGIANLTYRQPTSNLFLIGGVGLYRGYIADIDDSDDTNAGINIGAGYRIPLTGFSTFIEARFHHVFSEDEATQFIPISFGVKF
jgi:hypothetical protein